MAIVSVASKLRALKKMWKGATPRTGGGLPDGEYEGVIKTAVIGLSKSDSKRLQAVWALEVTAPEEFAGRKQTKTAGLETDTNLDFFQGDLAVLGIDPPDDENDIPDAVGQTEGLPIAFKVRSKDEFTNVDFIGLLEGVETDQPEPEAPEEGGENDLTAEMVTAMGKADDEAALQEIIDDYKLDINQDAYVTYAEVAKLVIEALEL
jgi:hypothetical protein